MSMADLMDDALLGVDDDELDYDLEKDEEDALLADDNYDEENYEDAQGVENGTNVDEHFEETVVNEEESDVLVIDANVHLDETEEDTGDRNERKEERVESIRTTIQEENDDGSDQEVEEQKERNRFLSERNNVIQKPISNEIPDTLDKVELKPLNVNNQKIGKFQRGNRGRGRGRQNHNNRGSVFGRVGTLPPEGGKTVLINPHFRGNVQANENARLIWDASLQNSSSFSQQKYSNPQMAQVAPFQSQFQQTPAWIPSFNENTNYGHSSLPQNFQEPSLPMQYNQPPPTTDMNMGIRPLIPVNQPPPFVPHQQPPPQGNFRGRDNRFNTSNIQPLMSSTDLMDNHLLKNQRRPPYMNQNQQNIPSNISGMQMQQNYIQPPFENPSQQPFLNQFPQNNQMVLNQQYPPPQFHQPPPPLFDSYNNQNNQFNSNHYSGPPNQYHNQQPVPQNNNNNNNQHHQNFSGHQNFQQQSYESNFNVGQQEQYSQQYNRNQFNQNRMNNQQRQNRQHQMSYSANRSPPKRRSFDNSGGGDRDMPKKKKRSLELSNLHEVPTVDMPDTTTEDKIESEDEETKEYRLKIEEQKKLREQILREKEARRKLAAAQKSEGAGPSTDLGSGDSLLTSLKTKSTLPAVQSTTTNTQRIVKPQQQPTNPQIKPLMQTQNFNQQRFPSSQNQQHQQNHQQIQSVQQHQGLNKGIRGQSGRFPRGQQPNRGQGYHQGNQQGYQPGNQQRNAQNSQNIHIQTSGPIQRTNRNLQPRRIVQQNRNRNQNQNILIQQQQQQQPQQQQQQKQQQQQQQKQQQQQQRIVVMKQLAPRRRVVLKGSVGPSSLATETTNPNSNSNSSSNSNSNSNSGQLAEKASPDEAPANLSSFLSNRKVISNEKAGVELGQSPLLPTPVVVVSNLAAGTTDVKIRKLCQGLGPIQNIQMIPNSRQATIRFKNIVSAHKFFKKYQRKIIDLSMIQVSLEPLS